MGNLPAASLPDNTAYSARWSGFVQPQYAQVRLRPHQPSSFDRNSRDSREYVDSSLRAQEYTWFAAVKAVQERLKVWIDNSIIVDQWSSLEGTETSGTLMIGTADAYYDVRLSLYSFEIVPFLSTSILILSLSSNR